MSQDNTPPALSEERLAQIRQHIQVITDRVQFPATPGIFDVRNPEPETTPDVPMAAVVLGMDILELLAEVERLQGAYDALVNVSGAAVKSLDAKNAAMREIVQAVALDVALYEAEPSHIRCAHCRALGTPWQKLVHQPTCVVVAARKLKDAFDMEEYAESEAQG